MKYFLIHTNSRKNNTETLKENRVLQYPEEPKIHRKIMKSYY